MLPVSEHLRMQHLLGPYVLGDLTPEERREVEVHLDACVGCRKEADGLRLAHERLADLAGVTESPPSALEERVLARMPRRAGRSRLPLAVVAAVLAVLVVLYSAGVFEREAVASATLKPTELAPEAGGELRVVKRNPNAQARLEVWGMPRPGKNEYYELWFREEEGRVSAGTFTVDADGRTTLYMSVPEEASGYGQVGITLEKYPEEPRMSSAKVVLGGEIQKS